MENVTLTEFLRLATLGFGCGFTIGMVRWGVRSALKSVQYAVTVRA